MLIDHVRRGVVAGLVAGLLFGLLTALVANPLIGFADGLGHGAPVEGGHHDGTAVDHEHDGTATADHHEGGHGVVSLAVTEAVSVGSAVLWGVLLGAVVFGAAFYLLEPAIPGTGATKSAVAGAAGFLVVSGAPWLALPPTLPGAEQALATGTRLQLYAGMMVAGAVAVLLAGLAYRRVRRRRGRALATATALVPVALLAVPATLAPAPGVEHGLQPELAAGLTGLVVLGQLALWAIMAGVHAWLSRDDALAGDAGVAHVGDGGVAAD